MGATGGPLDSISIAGRDFACPADADVNRVLGGWINEQQSNGDGSTRMIKTRIPWSLGGVAIEVDNDNEDQEFIQAVQDSQDNVDIVATYPDGTSYTGRGNIDGEAPYSNSSATMTFDLKGPGKLKKL